ncbi:exosortase F system-associated membrane protein [Flavobacterium commune]|uniref:Exosortase F system-associated protein n=1 Tax=Flavobacterium commune TaxID=1306519 RepID=A0A1D9PBL2_9FLAO|nr:exosortase F system-associated protein [Flavobacterium commune]AOZ99724.1 exosortase F system-associated protein [Flavobacterium commune]
MLNKIVAHPVQLLLASVLVFCLVLVRFYEEVLFYDPFLAYFKSDFNNLPLPVFNTFLLILNLLSRYGLNMLLSLGLLYVIFKDVTMIRFSFFLYLIAFVLLLFLFFSVIYFYGAENNFLLFNVRRFLIQPIFVLLFIPAFYFQKQHS